MKVLCLEDIVEQLSSAVVVVVEFQQVPEDDPQ